MYEKPKYCSEIPSGGLRLCTETVTFRRVCASCARVGILVLVSSDARSTQPDDEGRTGDRRARRKVVRHLVQGASHSRHFHGPQPTFEVVLLTVAVRPGEDESLAWPG